MFEDPNTISQRDCFIINALICFFSISIIMVMVTSLIIIKHHLTIGKPSPPGDVPKMRRNAPRRCQAA